MRTANELFEITNTAIKVAEEESKVRVCYSELKE